MPLIDNQEVAQVFAQYPQDIRKRLLFLRQLILDTAANREDEKPVEETLKWGEPSYLVRGGSTVRLGWKSKQPQQYAIYFHCQTTLVETFKELYPDIFCYDGNRAIIFNLDDDVPTEQLMHCILLSLEYHKRKHLPLLGA
ncbi:DUF1801 domain-containing protein [Marinicella sp. W31]|uniref:DUF1801 domain-containing protein n=1 Tax=Marinicella sp. W31 TaxID=3023713 RepID=UPI0037566B0B